MPTDIPDQFLTISSGVSTSAIDPLVPSDDSAVPDRVSMSEDSDNFVHDLLPYLCVLLHSRETLHC